MPIGISPLAMGGSAPGPFSAETLTNVVKDMPHLVHWTAQCFQSRLTVPFVSASVPESLRLETLRYLSLTDGSGSPSSVAELLVRISAPNLQELSLRTHFSASCVQTIICFVQRSGCQLRKLILVAYSPPGIHGNISGGVPILKETPSLVELAIQCYPDQVWGLDMDNGESLLPPKLAMLTLNSDMYGVMEASGALEGVRSSRPGLKMVCVRQLFIS
jgi:hypothetical protein